MSLIGHYCIVYPRVALFMEYIAAWVLTCINYQGKIFFNTADNLSQLVRKSIYLMQTILCVSIIITFANILSDDVSSIKIFSLGINFQYNLINANRIATTCQ